MHKQLQDFLNECIKRGWGDYKYIVCLSDGIEYKIRSRPKECTSSKMSYHDLFSIESGLMEFVEWKDNRNEYALNPSFSFDGPDCDCSRSGSSYDKATRTGYHYMTMGPIKAEQKIQYFLDNALLP